MPELPDIAAYLVALERRIEGATLRRVRIKSPFLLRTAQPPIAALEGRTVRRIRRLENASRSLSMASCGSCCI